MIAFHDFIPQRQGVRYFGIVGSYENLHELVSRANRWIEQNQADVITVETVLLSSLPGDEESPKVKMDSPGASFSVYQIVRIWYRVADANAQPYIGQTTRLTDPDTE